MSMSILITKVRPPPTLGLTLLSLGAQERRMRARRQQHRSTPYAVKFAIRPSPLWEAGNFMRRRSTLNKGHSSAVPRAGMCTRQCVHCEVIKTPFTKVRFSLPSEFSNIRCHASLQDLSPQVKVSWWSCSSCESSAWRWEWSIQFHISSVVRKNLPMQVLREKVQYFGQSLWAREIHPSRWAVCDVGSSCSSPKPDQESSTRAGYATLSSPTSPAGPVTGNPITDVSAIATPSIGCGLCLFWQAALISFPWSTAQVHIMLGEVQWLVQTSKPLERVT